MKNTQIKQIADRISKQYGMVDSDNKPMIWLEKINQHHTTLRTELTFDEGGEELINTIHSKLGYDVESDWSCIYHITDF